VTLFSLSELRRIPLGVDDDFFAIAEVDGSAVYLGVRALDQRGDEPALYAMEYDDPGAATPVGKRLGELLEHGPASAGL
jgi:hypothetical protein